MKGFLKRNFKELYALIKMFYLHYLNSEYIRNYFKSSYSRKALLSYTTVPFKKSSKSHTNYYEALSIAKSLHELGYVVDVINSQYSGTLSFSEYDVLVGSGNAFIQYFSKPVKKIVTICYCTGLHPVFQNEATLNKLKQFYDRRGIWIGNSCRYVELSWTHQIHLADALLVLGNDVAYKSFVKFNKNISLLPTPFYKTVVPPDLKTDFNCGNKNFLWIGGSGLLHKGLDLLFEVFLLRTDINLFVMGDISVERDFLGVYLDKVSNAKNIFLLGFVDVDSDLFRSTLQNCTFVVSPSVSEGGSPSVVTAVGNWGLFPLLTRESSVDFIHSIIINDFQVESTELAIDAALSISAEELKIMRVENYIYTNNFHGSKNYFATLKSSLKNILLNYDRKI